MKLWFGSTQCICINQHHVAHLASGSTFHLKSFGPWQIYFVLYVLCSFSCTLTPLDPWPFAGMVFTLRLLIFSGQVPDIRTSF